MSRYVHALFLTVVVLLWLWPGHLLADDPVPPLPAPGANPSPPELDALPPPPQLEWQPLGPKDTEDSSGGVGGVAVPVLQPEPSPTPPPLPVIETPLPPPDPAEALLLKPEVEVWRSGSETPQVPPYQFNKLAPAYLTGAEPVWLRVQFDPGAAGKTVYLKPSRGITLDPPGVKMTVPANGEYLILAQIAEGCMRSHIVFYCMGVKTVLPVVRAPLAMVEAMEGVGE